MIAAKPVVPLFSEERCLHLADEALFGEPLAVLYHTRSDLLCVRTENEYCALAHESDLCEEIELGEERRVASSGADVLPFPRGDYAPLLLLPRFARLRVLCECGDFCQVALPNHESGYVRTSQVIQAPGVGTVEAVCATALSFLGTPYRFGGRSSFGVDCSGLLCLCFASQGVRLPRDTALMNALCEVPAAEARRGDLVLFCGHVGLLLSKTRFLHASAASGQVTIGSLDAADPLFDAVHASRPYSFRRPFFPAGEKDKAGQP